MGGDLSCCCYVNCQVTLRLRMNEKFIIFPNWNCRACFSVRGIFAHLAVRMIIIFELVLSAQNHVGAGFHEAVNNEHELQYF